MNPQNQPTPKAGPTLVRDVSPPATLNAEMVNDIPVQKPGALAKPSAPQAPGNPAAQFPQPTIINPAQVSDDKELDQILQDVNNTVRKTENSIDAKFEHLTGVRKKVAVKNAKIQETHNGSPPIVATIIACLVALILSVGAVLAFKQ